MADERNSNDIYASIKENIKKRVYEQLQRHRVDPNMDPRKIVDIQIKQERERLERMIEQQKNSEDPGVELIDALEALIKLLPSLAEEIKGQYR